MEKISTKKSTKKKLTAQQLQFAKEYSVCLSGKQAAIRAGYSEATAKEQGCRLLTDVNFKHVQIKIKEIMDKRSKILDVKAERIILELEKMAYANMDDYISIDSKGDAYVDLKNLDRDQMAAISEITSEEYTDTNKREIKRTKIKLCSKKDAIRMLGQHLSMFNDKLQHLHGDADDKDYRNAFFGIKKDK